MECSPESAKEEAAAEEKIAAEEKASSRKTDTPGKKVSRIVNNILNILKNNTLSISRKNENLITMPAWAFALVLLFTWKWMIWVIVISLFFQVRYSFEGKDDLSAANDFMDKVSSMAEDVASEFKK